MLKSNLKSTNRLYIINRLFHAYISYMSRVRISLILAQPKSQSQFLPNLIKENFDEKLNKEDTILSGKSITGYNLSI